MKITEFANSIDPDEAAHNVESDEAGHNELSHLDLHYLPSSLCKSQYDKSWMDHFLKFNI